ncbi:cation-translocating P-type ATPase [Enterococcus xiangfangensis]|uniref:cation-translocating P-type ATPase n=1 Tax=Enterococcus xiangfangensis TaxID=1296537 RepID=UPI0010F8C87D|nr:cation-transporting P-type ATPase [Enterococcus xiangfangensis]MBM7712400.1 potassium/sodium efflux P-type ATPase [Enterococcus xiangfangensis]NBK08923.1 cation-transporting P-type ATPase [Enterococcus asini]
MNEKEQTSRGIESLQVDAVYQKLESRPEGLTDKEVLAKRTEFGINRIEEAKGESIFIKFIKNFISLMAILLWVGGAVALFFTDTPQLGVAIWLVNIINGLFSFFQENRASKATEALKKMLPSYARVIRNGKEEQILTEDLVPGDVLLIEEGDRISADGRLIQATDLQVNQSALTGESNPVRKNSEAIINSHATKLEFKNIIFAGTSVSNGSGKVVVSTIGMNTEFGKIAGLTQSLGEEKSPLQLELDRLTKQISLIAISVGLFFLVAAVFFVHQPVAKAFIFSLGMIVAFIPEGLLPTVTLSLAMAVQKMAKEHALVKKLSSVETLGATSVICSDKTGTLTQNEMTVNHVWLLDQEYEVTGLGYAPKGKLLKNDQPITAFDNETLEWVIRGGSLCSNARVLPPDDENLRYTVLGDPTEACLNVVAEKAGIDLTDNEAIAKRVRELPFDSNRKRMTTIHAMKKNFLGSKQVSFTKGAPMETVDLCKYTLTNGELQEITQADRDKIMEANDQYARQGLRVLAVACRLLDQVDGLPKGLTSYTPEMIEQDMIFLGLVVMADPPRVEVSAAVEKCHRASIRIIMITGDYGLTAVSIAKRIGIVKEENPRVVTGIELESMTDEELKKALSDEIVFARVAPEQKFRVVTNLQEMGNVVAVTGDGVNDAPALKKADIGVAMGITGTDVAKESADMILTDDNFASIVRAVEEGRAVYTNIQKFLAYIFNSNTSEAVPSAAFLFSRGVVPLPLTVMQILAVDLGTDMVPALGLGIESPEEGIMSRPPRSRKAPLLNKKLLVKSFIWYGLLEATVAMGAFFFSYWLNGGFGQELAASGLIYRQATTMTLGAIIFCQIGAAMNCRTEKQSIFKTKLFSNRTINFGLLFEIFLFCLLAYVPIFHSLFNTAPIALAEWIYLILCPIPIIGLEEIRKAWLRKKSI